METTSPNGRDSPVPRISKEKPTERWKTRDSEIIDTWIRKIEVWRIQRSDPQHDGCIGNVTSAMKGILKDGRSDFAVAVHANVRNIEFG